MDEILNIDKTILKMMLNDVKECIKLSAKEGLPIPKPTVELKPRPKRCEMTDCKQKLGLTDSVCKCVKFYCIKHRHAETHSCTFDYKGEGMNKLKAQLVEAKGIKVENI